MRIFLSILALGCSSAFDVEVQAELNQCHDKSCAGVYGGVSGMGGRQAVLKEMIDAIVAPFTTTEENLTPNGLKNIMLTIIAPVLKSSPAFEGANVDQITQQLVDIIHPLMKKFDPSLMADPVVFNHIWDLTMPLFDEFYGNGLHAKNIATCKAIVKSGLMPILKSVNGTEKPSKTVLMQHMSSVMLPAMLAFPAFEGADAMDMSEKLADAMLKINVSGKDTASVFEEIWAATLPIFDQFYGSGKVAHNTDLAKSMLQPVMMEMFNKLDGFNIIDPSNLIDIVTEQMGPIFQQFDFFQGVNIAEISSELNNIIAPIFDAFAKGEKISKDEMLTRVVFEESWMLTMPLFDEFYGEGLMKKNTDKCKAIVKKSLEPILAGVQNPTFIQPVDLLIKIMDALEEVYNVFPAFEGADFENINLQIANAMIPLMEKWDVDTDMTHSIVFEKIWAATMPVFDEFYGEGRIRKNTKMFKEMMKPAMMSIFGSTTGYEMKKTSDLLAPISLVMTPIYDYFGSVFQGTDVAALNQQLADVIMTNMAYFRGKDADEEQYEIMWDLTMSVFGQFYGKGKEQKMINEVKSTLAIVMMPMLRNLDGKKNICRNELYNMMITIMRPITETYPAFEGANLAKMANDLTEAFLPIFPVLDQKYSRIEYLEIVAFEQMWTITMPPFEQFFGEGLIKKNTAAIKSLVFDVLQSSASLMSVKDGFTAENGVKLIQHMNNVIAPFIEEMPHAEHIDFESVSEIMEVGVTPLVNLFENAVPFEDMVIAAMQAKEKLNTKTVKNMFEAGFMMVLDNLDISKAPSRAELKDYMNMMKPIYAAFPVFTDTDLEDLNESILQILLPFIKRLPGITKDQLMMDIAYDQIWAVTMPIFDEFYGENLEKKNTATAKNMIMSVVVPAAGSLGDRPNINPTDFITIISSMLQPVYAGFSAFDGADTAALNEAVAVALLPVINGKTAAQMKSPLVHQLIWDTTLPIFDEFYGEGLQKKNTAITKELIKMALAPVLKNTNSKITVEELAKVCLHVTKNFFGAFPSFNGADIEQISLDTAKALMPIVGKFSHEEMQSPIFFERIWVDTMAIYEPFFGKGLVAKNTAAVKELLREPMTAILSGLSGKNTAKNALDLTDNISMIMAPIYNAFPAFRNADTNKVTQDLVNVFAPLLSTLNSVDNAENLIKQIVVELTWGLTKPVFDELYGQGLIKKNIATVKSILKTTITPILANVNVNGDSNGLKIIKQTMEAMEPIYSAFPAFEGANVKQLNNKIVKSLMHLTPNLVGVDKTNPLVFEMIWDATMDIFDEFYGEGKVQKLGVGVRKSMIPAINEMTIDMLNNMFPIFEQNSIY